MCDDEEDKGHVKMIRAIVSITSRLDLPLK